VKTVLIKKFLTIGTEKGKIVLELRKKEQESRVGKTVRHSRDGMAPVVYIRGILTNVTPEHLMVGQFDSRVGKTVNTI
jgi:hypothetical protein